MGSYITLNGRPAPSPLPTLSGSVLFGASNEAITAGPACFSGDPVNCATGNLVESATDLTVVGRGRALVFSRTYNAQDATQAIVAGPLGFGWSFRYGVSISTDASGAKTVHQANGSTVTFVPNGSAFTAPAWVIASLARNADGTFTFTLPDQRADVFDATGRLLRETDRNGYQSVLVYDADGHLSSVIDSAGRMLRVTTGTDGLISSVGDPIGRTVHYAYDAGSHLTSVTDVAGGVTRYDYDAQHLLVSLTDPNGGVTTNGYDEQDRVVRQTDPAQRTMSFVYATGANGTTTTTVTDANGHATVQVYTNNLLTSLTHGAGTTEAATWTYGYDAAFNRTSITDANQHVSTVAYDTDGNLLSQTDPLGRTTTFTYDNQNNPTSRNDPLGVATTLSYDAHGNLTRLATKEAATSIAYEDAEHPGDATAVTDPNGQTVHLTYDSHGEVVQRTDAAGNTLRLSYNNVGWPTALVSPRGFTSTASYNAFGDPTQLRDALGHTSAQVYDANRNRVAVTDSDGHTTRFAYDPVNELVQTTRGDGSALGSTYDNVGNLVTQTDALGHTTSYAFDVLDQLVSTTDPLGRVTGFAYDPAGNRTTLTDPAGQTTTFTYDAANQRVGIQYSGGKTPNVTFRYDADGQRVAMSDGTGTSTYSYDTLHRLTAATDGSGARVAYGYDPRGDLTSLTYPSGKHVARGFDALGRLTSVEDWLAHSTLFRYDADGNLVEVEYPNQITATFSYDQADRLTAISDRRGNAPLLSFDYTRDNLGLLATADQRGAGQREQAYQYTALNQLSEANHTTFEYDHADNLVRRGSSILAYDAANELATLKTGDRDRGDTTTFTYDVRGNRLLRSDSGKRGASYSYDQANRLVAFTAAEEDGVGAQYAYNGDGLRTSKTVGGRAETFAWSLAQPLPLLLQDGSRQFIYGPRGMPLAQVESNGRVSYFHQDQLGSTRALTNAAGHKVAVFAYDAYGQPTGPNQAADVEGEAVDVSTPLGYAGQFTDAETGFVYMRARYYDPSTAQFLTREPLLTRELPGARARRAYAYASGNPLNRVDLTGFEDQEPGFWAKFWTAVTSFLVNFATKDSPIPLPVSSGEDIQNSFDGTYGAARDRILRDALQSQDVVGQYDPAVKRLVEQIQAIDAMQISAGNKSVLLKELLTKEAATVNKISGGVVRPKLPFCGRQ